MVFEKVTNFFKPPGTSANVDSGPSAAECLLQSLPWPRECPSEAEYREKVSELVAQHFENLVTPQRKEQRRLEKKINEDGRRISEHQEAMREQREKHLRKVREMEVQIEKNLSSHRSEVAQMHQEIRKLHHDHQTALQSLQDEKREMSAMHNATVESLEQEHAQERTQMIHQHAAHEESMASKHAQEIQHFRYQVEELNAALFVQDDEVYTGKLFSTAGLPQMSDGKLSDSLSKIIAAVDYLARLEWRGDQSMWPEQDVERLRGPEVLRKAKKAILQDAIWCLLFEFVFDSPFRMFGDQGRALETQWAAQSREGIRGEHDTYHWPPPSAQTERWRYMTLAKCREALTQPLSTLDSRAEVKKGFIDFRKKLTHRLGDLLNQVIFADAELSRRIQELSGLAQTTWLEFQMHRCRIIASLADSGTRDPQHRLSQVCNGHAMLTLSPKLERFGNIKGTDLLYPTTITNCDGEFWGLV